MQIAQSCQHICSALSGQLSHDSVGPKLGSDNLLRSWDHSTECNWKAGACYIIWNSQVIYCTSYLILIWNLLTRWHYAKMKHITFVTELWKSWKIIFSTSHCQCLNLASFLAIDMLCSMLSWTLTNYIFDTGIGVLWRRLLRITLDSWQSIWLGIWEGMCFIVR